MKNFKQLIRELPSNTVVCALGDFDPPTVSHELLIKTVNRLAESKNSAHVVFTSPSKTLQEEKKSQYLKLMFPKTNFKSIEESFTLSVEQLKTKYKNVIVVVGTEQSTGLKKALKESVEFVTINEKNPDADTSKMKSLATKALYEEFKKKLPSTLREIDSRRLMNDVRIGMGLDPIKEQLILVKDKLREQYFRGEIFNEGDAVTCNGELYIIVKRGSNHLLLKEQSGELVSKWIKDVKQIDEGVIQPNGTDKIDPNAPQSDTGAKQDVKPQGKTKGFLTFYNYNTKDQVKEEIQIDELSTDLLARYKTASAASAKEADASGNYTKGDKRFKGINKATIKQFDNDLKKHNQLKEEPKKKVVCPECGKNPCECGEERPNVSKEMNPTYDPFFKEEYELSEKEIDEIVNSATDEDIMELYEENELIIIDEETGEELPAVEGEDKIDLMEVLSRQERMRAKMRLRRTSAKRERSTKIALKRYSSPETINKRARRLAIKLMKKRLLRGRDATKISVGEKERIEKTLAKRKAVIGRVAQKLVSRVRKVEKNRMSHGKLTKGNMPSVF